MALTPVFIQNILKVIDDTTNLVVLEQPFKPTSTGAQEEWTTQQEALDWWNTQQSLYTHLDPVPAEPTPPTE